MKDPDNSIVVSGKLSLSQISVYQIENPKVGAWTLSVSGSNGEHEFFVKSSSETNVDFEHYFITTLPGRSRREVPVSHPTTGMLRTFRALTICWNWLAGRIGEWNSSVFAEPRELLTTQLVVPPEQGDFGQNQFSVRLN